MAIGQIDIRNEITKYDTINHIDYSIDELRFLKYQKDLINLQNALNNKPDNLTRPILDYGFDVKSVNVNKKGWVTIRMKEGHYIDRIGYHTLPRSVKKGKVRELKDGITYIFVYIDLEYGKLTTYNGEECYFSNIIPLWKIRINVKDNKATYSGVANFRFFKSFDDMMYYRVWGRFDKEYLWKNY